MGPICLHVYLHILNSTGQKHPQLTAEQETCYAQWLLIKHSLSPWIDWKLWLCILRSNWYVPTDGKVYKEVRKVLAEVFSPLFSGLCHSFVMNFTCWATQPLREDALSSTMANKSYSYKHMDPKVLGGQNYHSLPANLLNLYVCFCVLCVHIYAHLCALMQKPKEVLEHPTLSVSALFSLERVLNQPRIRLEASKPQQAS